MADILKKNGRIVLVNTLIKVSNMKINYLILAFLVLFVSCCSDKGEIQNNSSNVEIHSQLLNLKKPDVILNVIENGLFNSTIINSINFNDYNNNQKTWNFDVFANSNRIKSITFINPNNSCITSVCNFNYENNLISKVDIIDVDICQKYSVIRELKYNYEQNLLISIFAKYINKDVNGNKTLTQVGENYFSYNPNGTIAEIYSDIRPASEPLYGYQKKTFFYDSNNNVIEVQQQQYNSNTYDQKFIFEYNKEINPLKGIYVFSGIIGGLPNYGFESSLGPIFLSNNCIKSVKSQYLNNTNNFDNTIILTTNSISQKILDFGSEESYQYWFRNFIN